jgi:3-oxoacyl-[acyl-carrier protein] reductase
MGKLDGKVGIVTGAARGIGRAYARRLSALGARVAVFDINLRSFEEFASEHRLNTQTTVGEIEVAGGAAIGIQVNVAEAEAVKAAVGHVADLWGRVDILVANAGGNSGSLEQTKAGSLEPALLQLVMANNLFGTIHSVAAVTPIMKRQRSGKIITVASAAASVPSADGSLAHYATAKAGIAHYTRYLAQDLGPFGITANCIAPGVTASGRILETIVDAQHDELIQKIALRRIATVEDLANALEFLATDLSDYVTGALIPVDGGLRG